MKTTVAFAIHPRALKAFRAAARANAGTDIPTAEALFLKCLAATPAPGTKGRSGTTAIPPRR